MRRKKHHQPMMDQRKMWRTEGIVEPVISRGMIPRMVTMWMSRMTYCKPTMDESRMWRTEGILLESVKVGQYISDL
jgi:hypothetical protein